MDILLKHTWIFFIGITVANAIILRYRSQKYIAQNPELKEGYDQYVKGWLVYGNIPWIIMMIGNLGGFTESTQEYFNPRAMNPMVLIFHASVIVLWGLSLWWIYAKGGAEFIEKHPTRIKRSIFSGNTHVTAKQVKLFLPIMLLGGIMAMVMMWMMPSAS